MYGVGRIMSKRHSYWIYAACIIFVYTLVEGLRWGRGIDYNLYYYSYEDIANGFDTTFEPGYVFFCRLLTGVGVPYQGYIMLCSFILITAWLYFLRKHSQVIQYTLPFFFISFTGATENLVRQFLAFSFVLIGIKFLEERKNILFFLYACIGFLFHSAMAILIPIYFAFSYIKKPLLPPYLAISIYLVLWIIWNNSFMSNLTPILDYISFERFQHYADNAEGWLTGENKADRFTFGFLVRIRHFMIHAFVIYYGYKLVKIKPRLVYFYNVSLLGIILFPASKTIELFDRTNTMFLLFQSIIIGYILYYVFRTKQLKGKVVYLYSCFVLLLLFYAIMKQTLTSDFCFNSYIWDARGRETIPLQYFHD